MRRCAPPGIGSVAHAAVVARGWGKPAVVGAESLKIGERHFTVGGVGVNEGDVISIDCGAIVAGWHGDAAITVTVGDVGEEVRELLRVTEEALWRGLAAARIGGRVGDISHAIEHHLREQGEYGIVEDYTGHGIGTEMHLPPDVPNYGRPGRGPRPGAAGAGRGAARPLERLVPVRRRAAPVHWELFCDDGDRLAARHDWSAL